MKNDEKITSWSQLQLTDNKKGFKTEKKKAPPSVLLLLSQLY